METDPLAYRSGSDWAGTVTSHVVVVDYYCHDCGDVVDDCGGDGERAVLVVATVTVVPIVMRMMTWVVGHLAVGDDDDDDASMVKCSVEEWRTVQWLLMLVS